MSESMNAYHSGYLAGLKAAEDAVAEADGFRRWIDGSRVIDEGSLLGHLTKALEDAIALVEPSSEKLGDAIREALDDQGTLHCTRDWSAWRHGTMTADDFVPASEDVAAIEEIANAVIVALKEGA